jgi:small subunit ribosomal protein S6
MRRYETIVILDSDISEEERAPVFERVTSLFPQYDGFLVGIDEWGTRKLAYEIKKKPRGFYALIDFCGHGDLVGEMERYFRIDDRILKYMTVLIEENADVDRIKEEIAEKERKAAAAEAEAAQAAEAKAAQDAEAKAAQDAEAKAAQDTEAAAAESAPETETDSATEPVKPAASGADAEIEAEPQAETTEEE